jgi:hypothetical protein
MMGDPGLRAASLTAIASANYIARRLDDYYPVHYSGENGMVAHKCILDLLRDHVIPASHPRRDAAPLCPTSYRMPKTRTADASHGRTGGRRTSRRSPY